MAVLIVVDNPKLWPLDIPETEVVPAREYLTNSRFVDEKRANVFNLCRAHGYQSVGYYVSLLAAARGHKPLPSVTTLQDLRQSPIVRIVSEDLEALVQRVLAHIKADRFTVSIYFGRNLARRYDRLCQALFNYFPSPLLRAEFVNVDQWRLHSLKPISSGDIPASHRDFVIEQARRFFARPRVATRTPSRYEVAVLVDREAVDAPSDERALQRFVRAGRRLQSYPVHSVSIGRPRVLFVSAGQPIDWQTTIWNDGTLSPPRRELPPMQLAIDDEADSASPVVPPTAEEAIPVPARFLIRFDGGLALEVRSPPDQGDGDWWVRQPRAWGRRWGDVWSALSSDRDAARVLVTLDRDAASALYRALPPETKLLVSYGGAAP